jgi:2-phosphoglycerate kinase
MDQQVAQLPWQVLLIGGASGTGKTIAAEVIGRQVGASWLQVDDLRLTLQFGGLLSPEQHPDLFYFLQLDDVRQVGAEILLDKLIAIAGLMAPAVGTVIGHHVATKKPVVVEGDGISPALAATERGPAVRAVFLVETEEEVLHRNMFARGRGIAAERTPEDQEQGRAWARLAWLYNRWLEREARQHGLLILSPRPYETLATRILESGI